MSTTQAAGYSRTISGTAAGVPVINRHLYDCAVQSAADLVLIGQLPPGHRIIPDLCRFYANASVPALNFDLYVNAASNVDAPTNLLWDNQAVAASTAEHTAVDAGAYLKAETIGVDFDNARDIVMLCNSGFATAPAGSQLVFIIASMPVSNA
jgi:hypothetical protein